MSARSREGAVAVVGATGLQGGAVARRLLREGWSVRALTRDPESKKARPIAALGAELVQVDASRPATLASAFEGAFGVFNVQNHHDSSFEGEVEQGRNVVDAAAKAGVRLLVYGAAGPGVRGTGVGSWESKVPVIEHLEASGVPATVLRPMAFMELMSAKKFYPPVTAWHLMPRLVGDDRPLPWLSVEDVAAMAALAFADPAAFEGRNLALASELRTLRECREAYRSVLGRSPRRFPMPEWLFHRFVGTDETTMWRWLHDNDIDVDPKDTHAILPGAMTVEAWLERGRDRQPEGGKV